MYELIVRERPRLQQQCCAKRNFYPPPPPLQKNGLPDCYKFAILLFFVCPIAIS